MDRICINPYNIPKEWLPLIVLSDDRRGFLSWSIKMHSQGKYSHVMEMHRPRLLATQAWVYREVSIAEYLKPQYMLKFWRYKPITEAQRQKWLDTIDKDLKAPWWQRRYDFTGIIGQALHIRWFNNPFRRYCSERVGDHMKIALNLNAGKHPTPHDINDFCNKHPGMECIGYWFND